jgi:hypothetical protein
MDRNFSRGDERSATIPAKLRLGWIVILAVRALHPQAFFLFGFRVAILVFFVSFVYINKDVYPVITVVLTLRSKELEICALWKNQR